MPEISKLSGTLIDSVGKVDGVLKGDIASIVGLTVPSGTAYTPPLDTYSGATAAYSVRKLSSSYSGSCIEAYRVSDGATQDIGFDAEGLIDTAAIIAFGGASEVRVQTWYDQSGNTLDAVQTASANMARIYDGSSIYEDNGNPAVDFNNNQFFSIGSSQWTDGAMMASVVFSRRSGNDTYWMSNGSVWRLFYESAAHGFIHYGTTPISTRNLAPPGSAPVLTTARLGGGSADLYENGTSVASSPTVTGSMSTASVGAFMAQRNDGALRMDGTIQELIHWGSDQTSNRTGVEANLNSYFQIANIPATSGFLADYTGAYGAVSVRRLSNNATKCMRVRRSVSPFDEQDIGFDSNGDLDTAAIAAFGGSDPLTVSRWYDQSGEQNHATQGTATGQPSIYDGSSVYTENGKSAIYFDGNSKRFFSDATGPTFDLADIGVYAVFAAESGHSTFATAVDIGNTDANDAFLAYQTNQIGYRSVTAVATTTPLQQNLWSLYADSASNESKGRVNAGTFDFSSTSGSATRDQYSIGTIRNIAYWKGTIQEMVFFDESKKSENAAIETAINTYYSIY